MENGAAGPVTERKCWHCQQYIPQSAVFCPYCGVAASGPSPTPFPAYQPPKSTWESLKEAIRLAGIWIALCLLVEVTVNVILVIWGASIILPETGGFQFPIYVIVPYIVTLFDVSGYLFAAYVLFIIVAIVLSYIWMMYRSIPIIPKEAMNKQKEHSPLYMIATLFYATLFFNVVLYVIVGMFGADPTTPSTSSELWKTMFSLANASVWEEVITRLLFIGVPLLAYAFITKKKRKLRYYLLGGGFEMGRPEVALLIFSSAMFAAAHVFSWDLYKIPPTFVAGLAMGYLFLRFGIYASIMMHFFVDYLSIPLEVWPNNDGLTWAIGLAILVFVVIGSAYFVHYSLKVFTYLTGKEVRMTKKAPPPPQPYSHPMQNMSNYVPPTQPVLPQQPVRQPGDFGFVCRHCGNQEARYQDGALYCLRCGQKN